MGDIGNLEELIQTTIVKVGAIIAKPKMTEKLLSKPPYRFLHDTISAITAATSFGEGLFSGPESDSSTADKHVKMGYLDKIFQLVGICKGNQLQVRSLKVVQGLEPEYTNQFLVALAECSTDQNLDFQEAVQRCLGGEQPGQNPPPYRNSGGSQPVAESKEDAPSRSKSSSKPTVDEPKEIEAKVPLDIDQQMVAPERGKSRGGTRGGKPNQATADTGLGGGFSAALAPKLDAEIERCDGTEATTQALLGELITRPKLTEKLLSKPPFRFLFDVVIEVVRSTGFGRGLYSDAEINDSANMDKNQKMVFLEKIIKVVGVQLNTLVEARPNRIVAGLDPQITNNFLQLLAVAAKHMPDSSNAVRTVLEQYGESGAAVNSPGPVEAKETVRATPAPAESKNDDMRAPPQMSSQFSEPKEPLNNTATSNMNNSASANRFDDRKESMPDEKITTGESGDGDGDSKRSTRPTTARRRPPKVKDGATELQSKDVAPVTQKKTTGIIIDGANDDDDEEIIADETRLVDEMKPDAKSTGDNAGTHQSKLVQDIMNRQLEQEAAGRNKNNSNNDAAQDTKIANESNNAAGGSGIRLGRLRKTGMEKKGPGTSSTTNFAEGDLERIRASIQSLVQQTGPLGTCMDFIQEDISLMTSELYRWEEECRKYEMEYEDAKRKTKESLHPLKVELADLEDQIMEQISKISSAKATNARNDEKIQNILKMMANA